ncbi:MAG: SprT-like domain-containing protein [Victivallaceae bacterium]|nr:SprT-like domain-containing protein [Victivallaceae bacterium]
MNWEWEQVATYYLSSKELKQFKCPLFALKQMTSLGSWDSERRTIAINREFILSHRWEYVVEVLTHEIAHQYVSMFMGHDERPHGTGFRRACELFRIKPNATVRYKKNSEEEPVESQDRIVAKIHKLFALGQSDNKNEAETAMLKAQSLIHYYNIDLIETQQKQNYATRRIGECKLRHNREEYALVNFIAEFYFVRSILIRSYLVNRAKSGSVFELSGSQANVEIAHYVYDFIRQYIDRCWKLHPEFSRQQHKTDFALGIIAGFKDKVTIQHQHDDSGTTALVRRSDLQLQSYMKYRYPRLVTRRGGSRQENQAARQAGYKKGQAMIVNKGVTSTNKAQSRFLTE